MIDNPDDVWSLPYPDFVALMQEDNAPPGGSHALRYWCAEAIIDANAHVLDLACSTGFSSRSLAQATGCSGAGIDVSAAAIGVASRLAAQAGLAGRLEFCIGDAAALPFAAGQFTHVLAGSTFGFIHDRHGALRECSRVLDAGGALCVSCRHYISEPAAELLERFERAIGYLPDPQRTHAWWTEFFETQFGRVEEANLINSPASQEALTADLTRRINSCSHPLSRMSEAVRSAVAARFVQTREVIAENNRHQHVALMVWRR